MDKFLIAMEFILLNRKGTYTGTQRVTDRRSCCTFQCWFGIQQFQAWMNKPLPSRAEYTQDFGETVNAPVLRWSGPVEVVGLIRAPMPLLDA
jgi:hypothetical protein